MERDHCPDQTPGGRDVQLWHLTICLISIVAFSPYPMIIFSLTSFLDVSLELLFSFLGASNMYSVMLVRWAIWTKMATVPQLL
jgi:hypothetical protein